MENIIPYSKHEYYLKELSDIQTFCEDFTSDDANILVERGNQLAGYIARTGFILSEAKKAYSEKYNSEVIEMLKKAGQEAYLTSTVINKLSASFCAKEQYLVDFADRLNRCCTHQLEWCRTLISKSKAEMQCRL